MRGAVLEIGARWLGRRAEREHLAGRFGSAVRMFRQALCWAESARPGLPLVIALLNGTGIALKGEKRFGDASRTYRRALRLARTTLPPDHPAWPALYHNLGGLEHARGRHHRAEPFARRGLRLRGRSLGPDHPDVARDLAALGAILDGQRRHDEAEACHRRALEIYVRQPRRPYRDMASTLANLAACLHLAGRSVEARPYAETAASLGALRLGVDHPETAIARGNLRVIRRAL